LSNYELNRIYKQDCVDFMKKLSSNGFRVDVIVTSPPYNINKKYGLYKDDKEKNEYLNWLCEIASRSHSILKDNGSFFLNISGMPSDPILPFEVVNRFLNSNYKLQNTIHWIKSISIEKEDAGKKNEIHKDCSIGHFKPIGSERFLADLHEYIFHFTKEGNVKLYKLAIGVPYQDKTNIRRWGSAEDERDRGNVWLIPYLTIQASRTHPAVFPEKLPRLCIELHGVKPDMIVYDPFMGIGTTALACIRLGVNYLGTEIDSEYVKMAVEDIEKRKNSGVIDDWLEKKENGMT
jgi:site-specific DNA-methyltransferase (adenine-specific)